MQQHGLALAQVTTKGQNKHSLFLFPAGKMRTALPHHLTDSKNVLRKIQGEKISMHPTMKGTQTCHYIQDYYQKAALRRRVQKAETTAVP